MLIMTAKTAKDIVPIIRRYFETQPVEKAWLFGSFARGEETDESDVDILFTPQKDAFFSLLTYAHIHRELEALLNRKVDLVSEGTLRPMVAQTANKDKRIIYERSSS